VVTEWTVDELARATGTTVRNIRVYQDRGLLDPPIRRGRLGIYTQEHFDRLRLILRLLQRGYPMAAIAELLEAARGKQGLDAILGFDDAVRGLFDDESHEHLSLEELKRLFPGDAELVITKALGAGLLERDAEGFVARAPGLLRGGAELVSSGLPVHVVLETGLAIWEAANVLAERMVDDFVAAVWEPFVDAGTPADWSQVLKVLEGSQRSVLMALSSAFEAAIRKAIDARLAATGDPLDLVRDGTQRRRGASGNVAEP